MSADNLLSNPIELATLSEVVNNTLRADSAEEANAYDRLLARTMSLLTEQPPTDLSLGDVSMIFKIISRRAEGEDLSLSVRRMRFITRLSKIEYAMRNAQAEAHAQADDADCASEC